MRCAMERTWAYTSLNNLEHNTIDTDWLKTATRRMESDDGIVVVNRGFETEWGVIEHLAIKKGEYELSWEEKQRIKNEIFGNKCARFDIASNANPFMTEYNNDLEYIYEDDNNLGLLMSEYNIKYRNNLFV